ncbi:hypothetical protein [Nocardia sp. NPDC005978]|uniref:hypothetical protein n=1 Tax=unclassified Nocardia TaxID=2637762 RepID=UPI0033BD6015
MNDKAEHVGTGHIGTGAGTIPRPPFSTELLADLHAGNLPEHLADQLWPAVHRDPDAARYLRSLDAVNTRLRDLGRDDYLLHPMPDEVTDRLERMIDDLSAAVPPRPVATVHRLPMRHRPAGAAESAPPTTPSTAPIPVLNGSGIYDTGRLDPRELGDAPPEPETDEDFDPQAGRSTGRPSRRWRWLTTAAAATALLAGGVVAVDAVRTRDTGGTAVPIAETRLAADTPPTVMLGAMGRHELSGPLAVGTAFPDCLRAAGLDRPVLGARSVVFGGEQAVLVLLAGTPAPRITAVVLAADCAAGAARVLATTDIG